MKLVSKLASVLLLLAVTLAQAQYCKTVIKFYDDDDPLSPLLQTVTFGYGVTETVGCIPGPGRILRIVVTTDCSNGGSGCLNHVEPYFNDYTDLHGNSDQYLSSTQNSQGNVDEFVTAVQGYGTIPVMGKQCNGADFKAVIKFCPPDDPGPLNPCPRCPEDPCLGFKTVRCDDMNCLEFYIKNKERCPGCYLVTVAFTDGSTQVINLNFAGNLKLRHCFTKAIRWVTSISAYPCPGCIPEDKAVPKVGERNIEIEKSPETQPAQRIKVAPNPTKNVVNFDGEQLKDYRLVLTNASGQQVLQQENLANPVNLERLRKGIYFYRISDKNGYIQEGKIIKE